ncbi:uncharacterized protein LOC136037072 isoform X2 [Artemia franciscana]|uniref:Uncharacterized protein n=1 Tax=Artemia franciscana TaxID=6661 RepID=A0AA88L710_ARTSF|nr:hypothetical protein QYM36_004975 [Artemia franciscana]KAK2719338.1 hypothetical protein QYM36_004975 [Artemia franciscana]KAK2719339.1 hypothetical protein QYM36_004975 [Artemia franciscana]
MLFVILVLFSVGQSSPISPSRNVADRWWSWPSGDRGDTELDAFFKELFQSFIDNLKEGFQNLEIPPMDPYLSRDRAGALTDNIMDVFVDTSETKSSGYSYFNIDSVDTNLDQGILELNMSLPSLRILGDYYLDGTVYAGDPVFGFGTFTVQLHVVSCRGFADFISDEQGMKISSMVLKPIQFEALSPYFDNLMVSAPGAKDHVQLEVGMDVISNVESEVRQDMTIALEKYVNEALESLSTTPPTRTLSGN